MNIPLDFVSGNIHQYLLRLRRIIVKYFAACATRKYCSLTNFAGIYSRMSVCHVTLEKPLNMFLVKDQHICLIAQTFPYFGKVSLRNKCVLTCDGQKDGLAGILAFRARNLAVDRTSKIEMSGKGNFYSLYTVHFTHPRLSFFIRAWQLLVSGMSVRRFPIL